MKRNTKLFVGAVIAAASMTVGAVPVVTLGNSNTGVSNVIFNPSCNGEFNGPALTITGCLANDDNQLIDIKSDENVVNQGVGQASVRPEDLRIGLYSRLTIDPQGTATFDKLVLNIDLDNQAPTPAGVRFTSDGVNFTGIYDLASNGQNFFTLTGGPFSFITFVTGTVTGGTLTNGLWVGGAIAEVDNVSDTAQIRLGISGVTQVPTPGTLALLGMGLGLFGAVGVRRKRSA